jgi:hypothetical protein
MSAITATPEMPKPAMKAMIEEARLAAIDLLRAHRATLDDLAGELTSKETVSAARLAELVAEAESRAAGGVRPVEADATVAAASPAAGSSAVTARAAA